MIDVEKIREQIACIKRGERDCLTQIDEFGESLQQMLPVYEAVVRYKLDFDSPSVQAEYESRSRVFDALEDWKEGESPH